ncbi:hypothetical protein ACJX0J_030819 [Zea mays]
MHHEYVDANICSILFMPHQFWSSCKHAKNEMPNIEIIFGSLLKKISRRLMTLSFTIHLLCPANGGAQANPYSNYLSELSQVVSCIFPFLSQIIQFEDHSIFLKVPPNNVHSFVHPIFSTMVQGGNIKLFRNLLQKQLITAKYVFEPLN